MSETTFLGYVRSGLRGFAYVQKHNDITEGVPDLSLCFKTNKRNVWMELKATARWPLKDETPVWWEHFTEQQAVWLWQREGWLFVRVWKTYALFTGAEAWRMWQAHGYKRETFLLNAYAVWHNRVKFFELAEAIRG